ncbi:HAD family hydrolase [Halobacteriovorax sp. HLS]|uniref:HAD family hydrolase n=1 Tax=Halobacteriovorax sp. HLS TaxID=2234000 RepID=UPI000FD6F129|nr:HAD family hydrolase [Halobacteriovorax sp. HLS]
MTPKIVFSDFDGTLTKGTEFTAQFFSIIELLESKGIDLVIVTGRSLSWAHFLITHFTYLKYVIAEGGGVLVRRDKHGNPLDIPLVEKGNITHLRGVTKSLLKKFSKLKLSADSFGRLTDRAIELSDLLSDVSMLKDVKTFLDKEKIEFSTSNVHLNFWSGDISKYKAVKEFLDKYFPEISVEECIYFGDSLNDQSMFRYFEHSVGVSSINEILSKLEYRPKLILNGDENDGPDGVYNHLCTLLK